MTRLAVPMALLIAAALPFARTARYGIVNCDDYDYVQHAAEPGGLWDVKEAIWMPLTWLSYKMDFALAGSMDRAEEGNSVEAAYRHRDAVHRLMHAHSVLIHAVNAVLLWLLLRMVIARSAFDGIASGAADAAAAVAALAWAVHPLRCESVCWVASRKDVLSMMWMLAALALWVGRRRAFGVACFALSAMCKPSAMAFTPLAFVVDWLLLREIEPVEDVRSARALRKYLKYAVPACMSVALALFAGWAQEKGGATFLFGDLPLRARALNAAAAFGMYVKNTVWPFDLAPLPLYRWPEMPRFWLQGILMCAAAGWLAVRGVRSRAKSGAGGVADWLLAGLMWYALAVVPFLGLKAFGVEPFADRFTYIPAVGFSIMLAGALLSAKGRWQMPACTALALALGVCAWRQAGFWKDDLTLFGRCIAVEGEGHYDAWANLGLWHFEFGHDLARAKECFARACTLNMARAGRVYPTYFLTLFELGDRDGMKKVHQDFAAWDNAMLVKRRLKARGIGSTMGYLMVHAMNLTADATTRAEGLRELARLEERFPDAKDLRYARHLLGLIPADAVASAPDESYVNYRFLCGKETAKKAFSTKNERN